MKNTQKLDFFDEYDIMSPTKNRMREYCNYLIKIVADMFFCNYWPGGTPYEKNGKQSP